MYLSIPVILGRLELAVEHLAGEAFENESFGGFVAEFEGLGADWDSGFSVGLLGLDADAFASSRVVLDMGPFDLKDVGEAESCEAGE